MAYVSVGAIRSCELGGLHVLVQKSGRDDGDDNHPVASHGLDGGALPNKSAVAIVIKSRFWHQLIMQLEDCCLPSIIRCYPHFALHGGRMTICYETLKRRHSLGASISKAI